MLCYDMLYKLFIIKIFKYAKESNVINIHVPITQLQKEISIFPILFHLHPHFLFNLVDLQKIPFHFIHIS